MIFLGTSSGAGKTTLTALYCRYLKKKGVNVAPFKASNLSLNSFVTKSGGEIGMGQAFQAWASGIEPEVEMNPILLKPSGNGSIQLIVNGKAIDDISNNNPMDTKAVLHQAVSAFDSLNDRFDVIICEGSGSPVELNMMDRDIANIGMMRERKIPAVLVGDIERGGVFAAFYGTWLLMPEDVRPLLKGFLINRFRGEPSILNDAIAKIEELTGMRFLGTIPHMELKFPEEDSMSDTTGSLSGPTVMGAFMNNLDLLLRTATDAGMDLNTIDEIAKD